MTKAVDPAGEFAIFAEHWSPRIVVRFNGHGLIEKVII